MRSANYSSLLLSMRSTQCMLLSIICIALLASFCLIYFSGSMADRAFFHDTQRQTQYTEDHQACCLSQPTAVRSTRETFTVEKDYGNKHRSSQRRSKRKTQ